MLDYLRKVAQQNQLLSWTLKPNGITVSHADGLTLQERVTATLGVISARQQISTVIEHPSPKSFLSISAAVGILLADLYQRNTNNGASLFRDDLVYVTRQIGMGLSALRSVKLAKQSLEGIWSTESARTAIKREGHGPPRVLVATPQPGRLRGYNSSGNALVIDASHPLTLERLAELLDDPVSADAKVRLIVVPLGFLDQTDLFKDWDQWVWLPELCQSGQPISQSVFISEDADLDNHLGKVREKLSILSRSVSDRPSFALLSAWGIYHRLNNLSISLSRYEDHAYRHRFATPIKTRIEQLTISEPLVAHSNIWASEWPILVDELKLAYATLKGREPGKYWGLARLLDDEVNHGFSNPLTLVTPTQFEANLLIRELSHIVSDLYQHLHPEALTVLPIRTFAGQPEKNGRVIFIGGLTSRWRYLNAIPIPQYKLIYPHELYTEQSVIERLVKAIQIRSRNDLWLGHIEEFQNTQPASAITEDTNFTIDFNVSGQVQVPSRSNNSSSDSIEFASPNWAWDSEDITFVPPISNNASDFTYKSSTTSVSGLIEITFIDDRTIYVPADETLDVFRRVTDELEECPADQIVPGDILVLILDGKFTSLYDRIIEALEAHPDYALLSVWIKLWDIAKSEALEKCESSYHQLHSRITRSGFNISEQAVRTWFTGVMAPQSEGIIFKVIEISENKAAMAQKNQIRSSLGHVRGMRRKTGRKIRELIKRAATLNNLEELTTDVRELALEDVLAAAERIVVKHVRKLS